MQVIYDNLQVFYKIWIPSIIWTNQIAVFATTMIYWIYLYLIAEWIFILLKIKEMKPRFRA